MLWDAWAVPHMLWTKQTLWQDTLMDLLQCWPVCMPIYRLAIWRNPTHMSRTKQILGQEKLMDLRTEQLASLSIGYTAVIAS